jgi:hypothetical protein
MNTGKGYHCIGDFLSPNGGSILGVRLDVQSFRFRAVAIDTTSFGMDWRTFCAGRKFRSLTALANIPSSALDLNSLMNRQIPILLRVASCYVSGLYCILRVIQGPESMRSLIEAESKDFMTFP